MNNKMSVVIPSRRAEKTLEATLTSLERAATEVAGEIEISMIVVLSDSPDLPETFTRRFPRVRFLKSAKGRSQARNAGLAVADPTGLICFTDADTTVSRDFFRVVMKAFDRDPSMGGLAIPVIPKIEGRWAKGVTALIQAQTENRFISLFRRHPLGRFVDSAACAFRTRDLLAIGGFDETLIRQEDVDLSLRLVKNGRRLGFSDEASAEKKLEQQSLAEWVTYYFTNGVENAQLFKKWKPDESRFERFTQIRRAACDDLKFLGLVTDHKFLYFSLLLATRAGNVIGTLQSNRRAT